MLGAELKRFWIKLSNGSNGAFNNCRKKSKIFCGIHVAKFVIPQSSALTTGINNNNTANGINVLPQYF